MTSPYYFPSSRYGIKGYSLLAALLFQLNILFSFSTNKNHHWVRPLVKVVAGQLVSNYCKDIIFRNDKCLRGIECLAGVWIRSSTFDFTGYDRFWILCHSRIVFLKFSGWSRGSDLQLWNHKDFNGKSVSFIPEKLEGKIQNLMNTYTVVEENKRKNLA